MTPQHDTLLVDECNLQKSSRRDISRRLSSHSRSGFQFGFGFLIILQHVPNGGRSYGSDMKFQPSRSYVENARFRAEHQKRSLNVVSTTTSRDHLNNCAPM